MRANPRLHAKPFSMLILKRVLRGSSIQVARRGGPGFPSIGSNNWFVWGESAR